MAYADQSNSELRAEIDQRGLNVSGSATKAQMIEALEADDAAQAPTEVGEPPTEPAEAVGEQQPASEAPEQPGEPAAPPPGEPPEGEGLTEEESDAQAQERARLAGVVEQEPGGRAGVYVAQAPPDAQDAEALTYEDDEYTVDQLVQSAPELVGAPSYMVRAALSRFGGGERVYTLEQVRDAVDQLNQHEVEA